MKRLILFTLLFLSFTAFCCYGAGTGSYSVLYPDKTLYINGYAIPTVIIDDTLCVSVQDLEYYGFVRYSGSNSRVLKVDYTSKITPIDFTITPCLSNTYLGTAHDSATYLYHNSILPAVSFNQKDYVSVERLAISPIRKKYIQKNNINLVIDGLDRTLTMLSKTDSLCDQWSVVQEKTSKYINSGNFEQGMKYIDSIITNHPTSHHNDDLIKLKNAIAFHLYKSCYETSMSTRSYEDAIASLNLYFNTVSSSDKNYLEAETLFNEALFLMHIEDIETRIAHNDYSSALSTIDMIISPSNNLHYKSISHIRLAKLRELHDLALYNSLKKDINILIQSAKYEEALSLLNSNLANFFDSSDIKILREEISFICITNEVENNIGRMNYIDALINLEKFFPYATSNDSPYYQVAVERKNELTALISQHIFSLASEGDYDAAINILNLLLGTKDDSGQTTINIVTANSDMYSYLNNVREEYAYIRYISAADNHAKTGDFNKANELLNLFFSYKTSDNSPYYLAAVNKSHEYFYLGIKKSVDSYIAAKDYESALSTLNWALGSYDIGDHCGEPFGILYGENYIYDNNMSLSSPYFPVLLTLREEIAYIVAEKAASQYTNSQKYYQASSVYYDYLYRYCIPTNSPYYTASANNIAIIEQLQTQQQEKSEQKAFDEMSHKFNGFIKEKKFYEAYKIVSSYRTYHDVYFQKKSTMLKEICSKWFKATNTPLAISNHRLYIDIYSRKMVLEVSFVNVTDYPIKSARLSFIPQDLFGSNIYKDNSFRQACDFENQSIPAHGEITFWWSWDSNSIYAERLKIADDIKVTHVIYADNSTWKLC